MSKRAVATEPAPLVCEVCGLDVDAVTHRYPPSGLAVGLCCLKKTNSELAQAYGQRLKRAAERPR